MVRWRVCSILVPVLGLLNVQCGETQEEAVRANLLGDIGRQELSENGYTLSVLAVQDIWGNTTGGRGRGAGIIGNLNVSLDINTEKAGLWSGGQFLFYGIGIYGRQPSKTVGDYQYSSSIDSLDTFEPYEAFYAHNFLEERVNVLAGIHDFTTEFSVLQYGFTFLNSSFYTPPTITQRYASFYPNTSVGTRIKVKPTTETYVLAGLYDGTVTDPNRPRAVQMSISRKGGLYSIGEVGWQSGEERELYGKVGLGGWYSSAPIQDNTGDARASNYGAYVVGEHQLWGEEGDTKQGPGIFLQAGYADQSRNFNSFYYGGGLSYRGFFDCRDEDVLGIAFNSAQSSSQYRDAVEGTDHAERVFELNYRAKITEYFAVTPDVQYIVNPGLNAAYNDAVVVYLRTEFAL